jgi:beta-glucosidase
VAITVPAEKLAFYDENIHAFRVNPGPFQIMVGGSSDDIRAEAGIEVVSK